MNNLRRLLYVGSWQHFQPVYDFPDTKEFVFIEIQPFSEFRSDVFDRGFYREKFVENIINKAKIYEFDLIEEKVIDNTFFWSKLNLKQKICYTIFPKLIPKHVNPTLFKFFNEKTQQTINYFISSPFPEYENQSIIDEVQKCDGLILSGYFPNKSILQYFNDKKLTWIGYSGTYYDFDKEEVNEHDLTHIVRHMHEINEEERINYFDKYYFVEDILNKFMIDNDWFDDMGYEFGVKVTNDFILNSKPRSNIIECSSFDDFIEKKK